MIFIILLLFVAHVKSSFICPQANGFYSDPASVQMFYHCVNHLPYHKPCPSGLSWSNSDRRCLLIANPPVIEVENNACAPVNPCHNGGTCEPLGQNQFFCLCSPNYDGSRCENVAEEIDVSALESFFDGKDPVFETVVQRNNWTDMAVVVDVTGSMSSCAAGVYHWMRSPWNKKKNIHYYVFFNDGDDKPTVNKTIGSTGGIYGVPGNNLSLVFDTMQSAMKNGYGGDIPENDIEAILFATENCPTCKSFVHLVDNRATPRDLTLLNRVNKPIHLITCQMDQNGVNPQLLNIADRTGGSLHTLDEDVTNLTQLTLGQTIDIGRRTYRRSANGFVFN